MQREEYLPPSLRDDDSILSDMLLICCEKKTTSTAYAGHVWVIGRTFNQTVTEP